MMGDETKPCPYVQQSGEGTAFCALAETGIKVFEARAKDAERLAADWQHEFNMYRSAWIRELGGKVIPKTHEIDSLVLTTRRLRERAEAGADLKERVGRDGFAAVLGELLPLAEGVAGGLLRFYIKQAFDVAKNMEHAAAQPSPSDT
jgi:hypothetical protein